MQEIEFELNEKIHAIIINPYLTWDNFNANCEIIKENKIKNISTSLNYLEDLKKNLNNYKANINALISYPLADLPLSFIEEFISYAKDKGANGIEYIPNFMHLSRSNYDIFASEIDKVRAAELPVTIIINKSKLEKELFRKSIEISMEIGITSFQFGDGFGPPMSSFELQEITKIVGSNNHLKVVGGIKNLSHVIDLFNLGIDYVGTSNFYEIFKEIKPI